MDWRHQRNGEQGGCCQISDCCALKCGLKRLPAYADDAALDATFGLKPPLATPAAPNVLLTENSVSLAIEGLRLSQSATFSALERP